MKSHHHSVSSSSTTNTTTTTTRKPPLCPNRQQKLPGPLIPGVHSNSAGPNSRLINNSNTHFQNNHYTFSLTRNYSASGNGGPTAYGSSTGFGLNSYGYLDSAATLSSTSPYHYYYDGTGFRSAANQPPIGGIGGGLHSSRLGSIRGTKSDIGVPIRPKNQRHQQQQQYITNVHQLNRLGNNGSKRAMIPSTKTDYLENYKTGVERLKLNYNNNNSNPQEAYLGLLNSSASVQNIANNNYQPPLPFTSATGGGGSVCNSPSYDGNPLFAKGADQTTGGKIGPLVYIDSNQNRNSPGHDSHLHQANVSTR